MQIYKYVIKISKFVDMKKYIFLFILVISLFSACETEFNVNADWKEVIVVYGLLDQSQDKQYIRINKAFLGNEDAFVMASVADSINYNPNNLEVKIEKVSTSGNVVDTKILTDTIMFKEDGLFSVEENIIYVFDTDNFLNEEKEYKLTITNKISGNIISSQTKLIYNLTFITTFNHPFGFISNATGDSSYYSSKTISWNHSKNAAIYQMTLIVNYTEESNGIVTSKQVEKVYPLIDGDGSNLSQKITGEDLFNLLASIEASSTVTRRVNDLDLLFSVGMSDLNTYIYLNEPPTGIVQERDLYTNIYGGIGLFSARNSTRKENIDIATDTKQAIADSLQHLNFIYP